MKKYVAFMLLLCFSFFSCVSNETKTSNSIDISLELNRIVIIAADDIIEKLPPKTKVALFNISTEETELTNFIIEEIATILVNKGGLIIVDRRNLESIISESNFQMSGSVRDEDIISIANKYGAESVVSCSITGTGILQRLRVRTLDVGTGAVQALTSHTINNLDNQNIQTSDRLANKDNSTYQTIKENGITIDYIQNENRLFFNIYIDETNNNFTIDFYYYDSGYGCQVSNLTNGIYSSSSGYLDYNSAELYDLGSKIYDFGANLTPFFIEQGINRRNVNNILTIVLDLIYKIFQ